MRAQTTSAVAAVLVFLAFCGAACGQQFSQRQFYSGWNRHSNGYHYRHYYYKPTPQYAGFKHHYVLRLPQKPHHLYFYNPYKGQFWGRCPSKAEGKPLYSLLAQEDRKSSLKEIPESAFPEPGPLPPIPESEDGATLDLPPDDLPSGDQLP